MSMHNDLTAPIASIVAALIAGAIAYLVSVFTKEAKTSEFRQAWIDGLRSDVAELLSVLYYLGSDIDHLKEAPDDLDWPAYTRSIKEELLKIELMQTRIELRLNPKEHAAVIQQLRQIVSTESLMQDFAARKGGVESFIASMQGVLKQEWKRVKAGEPVYRWTKWVSLALAVFGLIFGACVLLGQLRQDPPHAPKPPAANPAAHPPVARP